MSIKHKCECFIQLEFLWVHSLMCCISRRLS